jgi:predicted house-cleaning noncanonical NTP pyrophosphatase (MazG superfamily)
LALFEGMESLESYRYSKVLEDKASILAEELSKIIEAQDQLEALQYYLTAIQKIAKLKKQSSKNSKELKKTDKALESYKCSKCNQWIKG